MYAMVQKIKMKWDPIPEMRQFKFFGKLHLIVELF